MPAAAYLGLIMALAEKNMLETFVFFSYLCYNLNVTVTLFLRDRGADEIDEAQAMEKEETKV